MQLWCITQIIHSKYIVFPQNPWCLRQIPNSAFPQKRVCTKNPCGEKMTRPPWPMICAPMKWEVKGGHPKRGKHWPSILPVNRKNGINGQKKTCQKKDWAHMLFSVILLLWAGLVNRQRITYKAKSPKTQMQS